MIAATVSKRKGRFIPANFWTSHTNSGSTLTAGINGNMCQALPSRIRADERNVVPLRELKEEGRPKTSHPIGESFMRAADALVDILRTEGVKFVSTLPGDDILPIFDALHEHGQVPLILTRHEQATVYIADGYARSTGEVGVAMVTKGPGRCNAFTAIVNAFTDCVPLVVIFGHSSRKQLAKGMLQEVPYLDTFQTMAKWTFSVPSAERIPEVFRRAFTVARSGRPGPVIIEVPQDISMAQAELPPYQKTRRVRYGPDPDDVDKLIELLQQAKQPLIYAGRGALWSRATEDLVKLAETYALPVMATLPAKGAMPEDHPLCLGLGGYPTPGHRTVAPP